MLYFHRLEGGGFLSQFCDLSDSFIRLAYGRMSNEVRCGTILTAPLLPPKLLSK